MLFFFQAEDGIRDTSVTGVQTCALPILRARPTGRGSLDDPDFAVGRPGVEVPEERKSETWEIGRASCRERVYVSGVPATSKENKKQTRNRNDQCECTDT